MLNNKYNNRNKVINTLLSLPWYLSYSSLNMYSKRLNLTRQHSNSLEKDEMSVHLLNSSSFERKESENSEKDLRSSFYTSSKS